MKKLLKIILLLIVGLFLQTQSIAKAPMTAQVQSHRIPEGTILKLKTYNTVSTKLSSADDQFDAMLLEDKKIGKEIVLPQGTLFRGRVLKVQKNRMLSKSAVLYLAFDNVITPTGKQIATSCAIYGLPTNIWGGITDNGNYGTAIKQNWNTAVNITQKATVWGAELDNPSKYIMAPLGAIGGATCSTVYFLGDALVDVFKKGSQIEIKQNYQINVILTKPLDIPIN